jgi:limonene-1,2-epoxide hydrolase
VDASKRGENNGNTAGFQTTGVGMSEDRDWRSFSPGECEPMTTEQSLAALRQDDMDAFNRRDAAAVAALHTERTVSMPAGMPSITGRESTRCCAENVRAFVRVRRLAWVSGDAIQLGDQHERARSEIVAITWV